MSALGIVVLVIHFIIALAVIFFALKRMQRNAELGGAFGSGASSTKFGREKGFDTTSKLEILTGILFMVSCFVTAMVI